LLRARNKPDLERCKTNTPLILAVENGNTDIVIELVKAGAKLDAKRKSDSATPLLIASEQGNADIVQLLIACGAKDRASTTNTVLLGAARNGYADICKLFLEQGQSSLEATRSSDDATALLAAAETGFCNVVQLLLYKGANVNAKTKVGNTALHLAAKGGYNDICTMLIGKRADLLAKNLEGDTAFDLAVEANQYDLVFLLRILDRNRPPNPLCIAKPRSLRSLVVQNRITMFRHLMQFQKISSQIVSCIVENERTDFLEFALCQQSQLELNLSEAQELYGKTKRDEIKNLLQKWINKKLGIFEVKKEEPQ
jgi:ankyrin repeat protein